MKSGLLFCFLCLWVVGAQAGVLWWGQEAPQADEPQPNEGEGAEVLRVVEKLSRDLQKTANQRDSWLTRYQEIADILKGNSELSTELLAISRVAVPIIWNSYMGTVMMQITAQLDKGGSSGLLQPHAAAEAAHTLPPAQPQFLYIYPTELTADSKFTVQALVVTTVEANVGFSIYFEPPEGEEVDFDNGDIFYTFHLRWHSDLGNSREIAFNDRYGGAWSPVGATVGAERWPNVAVGERFLIHVTKNGPCFQTFIFLGHDMHMNTPNPIVPMLFCPQHQRKGDPRKLWLTVNEDKPGAGEVIVHLVTWLPLD